MMESWRSEPRQDAHPHYFYLTIVLELLARVLKQEKEIKKFPALGGLAQWVEC